MTLWLRDPQAVRDFLADAPTQVGLDTEFIRERTFWPQLALVQIAVDDRVALIDPLEPGMPAAVAALLTDPTIVKVMHSPSEDLVAFQHACGVVPVNLFDTQHAAALVGIGHGMSYQKLVEAITGQLLPKGETRSNWLQRPLSEAQCHYAEDDVRHLAVVHTTLQQRLATLQRTQWMQDDMQRVLTEAAAPPERWPHLAFRTPQPLPADAQARVLRLLRWRETRARQSDRPRTWILDNALLLQIARQPPTDRAALERALAEWPKAPRTLAGELWTALSTTLPDEDGMPLLGDTRDDARHVRRLQDAVAAVAAELGIDATLLASRKPLQQWVETGQWPAALQGWRETLLREPLTALQHG